MKKISILLVLFFTVQLATAQAEDDKKAIAEVIQTLQKAWNSGDGNTFAKPFAKTHDFIVWNGFYFKQISQERNAMNHDWLFKQVYPNTDLYYVIDKISFIRPDVALVHVYGAVAEKGKPKPKDPAVLFSAIMDKSGDTWRIVSFHNLDLEIFQNEEVRKNAPIPPEVMYANWYASK